MLHRENDDKHDERQAQILERAEVGRGVAAAEGVHTDADKAQADGKHDGARNDRREEAAQGFQEEAQNGFEQTADERCAHDGAVGDKAAAHRCGHRVKHADEARRRAHDDGHLAADRANAEKLDEGYDARNPHGVLQQRKLHVSEFGAGQSARARHDKQRR